ncbi:MAG: thermonuclease family protein [Solirubrobacteraceae bacterium]
MSRLIVIVLVVLLAAAGGRLALEGEAQEGSVERVIDGDTLVVRVEGGSETVRLLGIDTPEVSPAECGHEAATRALTSLVEGRRVRLVTDGTQDERDRYGRLLAYVETRSGTDVGEAVVRRGWAAVYVFDRPFARVGRYRDAAREARSAGRGLSADCA